MSNKPGPAGLTQEQIDAIREALANGASAADIGVLIGRSRNAAIGLVHRHHAILGTFRRSPTGRGMIPTVPPVEVRGEAIEKIEEPSPRDKPDPKVSRLFRAPIVEVAPVGGVLFEEVRFDQCRYIAGLPFGEEIRCCGAPTIPGQSWCQQHSDLVYVAPERRRVALRSMEASAKSASHVGMGRF